jgi:hypothetical protein
MRALLESAPETPTPTAIPSIPAGAHPPLTDVPAASFTSGKEVTINASVANFDGTVTLHYRHLNQGEPYESVPMTGEGGEFSATIPGAYTDSDYPLSYYFVLTAESGDAWIAPGLEHSLADQPYHVIRQNIH